MGVSLGNFLPIILIDLFICAQIKEKLKFKILITISKSSEQFHELFGTSGITDAIIFIPPHQSELTPHTCFN